MNTFVADPEWGWWIVWYFFLGGIAAGAYFMAALVDLVGDERDRRLARVGYYLAAPLAAVCGVLLMLDLHQPLRFWHMLLDAETLRPHMKYWSPMSIGSWALVVFGAISTLSLVAALAEDGRWGLGRWAGTVTRLHRGVVGRAFDFVATVCGFFVASYTGALLTATNQPVWSNTRWIAALFLASAATSGTAAIQLICCLTAVAGESSRVKLERADTWALALELVLLGFFLTSLGSSVRELVGRGPFLWLLVGSLGGGVCVPLLLRLRPAVLGRRAALVSAVLVLAGGFVLRYAVLAAGPAMLDQKQPHLSATESATHENERLR
jgi:formate-dependent nitrite reductase membrane component NrfD